MTLQEEARQSGLVLLNETEEWNETDWPPLKGGWRARQASVVIDHTIPIRTTTTRDRRLSCWEDVNKGKALSVPLLH